MRGNVRVARIAGVVTLGGAFYTATYITSYPGGAPPFAVFCLLVGTAAGVLALVLPRSPAALTVASLLLGIASLGAFIRSGVAFGPGLVLMIVAAVRAHRGDDFGFLEEARNGHGLRLRSQARNELGGFAGVSLAADTEPVVALPEAEPLLVLPRVVAPPMPLLSSDGTSQAGPPGVIGALQLDPVRPPSRDLR
jgi:hypothetical protein